MSVIELSAFQKPVRYSVHIEQGYDGSLKVFVEDIASDERSRKAAADAMRIAADLIEAGEPEHAND